MATLRYHYIVMLPALTALRKDMADHSHANAKQEEWPLRHKSVSHVYSGFYYRQTTADMAGIMRGSKTTGAYFRKTGFTF